MTSYSHSVNKDFQNDKVMSVVTGIKDNCDKNFAVFTTHDSGSLALVTSDDSILKLNSLVQNFKDLFIGEKLLKSSINGIPKLYSETNKTEGFQNGVVLTENESEGYVFEHKSINTSKTSVSLKLSQFPKTSQNTFKTPKENETNDEKEVIIVHEDPGVIVSCDYEPKIVEKSDCEFRNSESEIESVNRKLLEEKNFDFFQKAYEILKVDCLTLEAQPITETDKNNSPCITVKSANDFEGNSYKDESKSIIIQDGKIHDIKMSIHDVRVKNGSDDLNVIHGGSSLRTERVLVHGDIEIDIHEAVRSDDYLLVRHLLAKGADPNEPDWGDKGDPPIVQAALRQNVSIVKALCQAGCDMNLTSVRGETALHMAVSRRPVNLELLDTLLAAGCDANMQDKLRGCSALHCVSGFTDEEPQVFHRLVTATDVNLRDHRHSTVLHRVAATANNVLTVKQLLELGADPSIQNDRGETALCVALERGWEAGALTLIAGGTDLSCTNLYRETVLHVAARHDQANIVAVLLQHGAEVNAQDLADNTALHLAAGRGYVDTVQQLLTCPHLDLDSHNSDQATPLTCAVESGFISVVQMLVKAEQVDLLPALDLAKQGYRRLSQPEMCQLLTKELERRQTPHLT